MEGALIMLHSKYGPSIPFWFEDIDYFYVKLCQNFTKQPVYLYGFCIANIIKNDFFPILNFLLKTESYNRITLLWSQKSSL